MELVREGEKFLYRLVETIVKMYNGRVSVILFGSRARGDHSLMSDFDIVVVLENFEDPFDEVLKIRRSLGMRRFGLDIIVLKPRDLENPIVRDMLRDYVILYDGLGVRKHLPKHT